VFGRTDHLVLAALTHRHGGNPQNTVRRVWRDRFLRAPNRGERGAPDYGPQEARALPQIGAFPGVFPLESAAVIRVKALPWLRCSVPHLWACTNLGRRSFGHRRRAETCGLIVLMTIFCPACKPFREPHKSTLLKHPKSNELFWLSAYRGQRVPRRWPSQITDVRDCERRHNLPEVGKHRLSPPKPVAQLASAEAEAVQLQTTWVRVHCPFGALCLERPGEE
jgi:hypothetical protein